MHRLNRNSFFECFSKITTGLIRQRNVIPGALVLESRKARTENAQTDSKTDLVSITSRCSEFEPAPGNSVTAEAEADNTYYSRMIQQKPNLAVVLKK